DRLIVPIKDGRARIIAFGGRAMRADQRGKYVNSQGTVLFNKSATLYALDAARAAIRKERAAVIVEGYFDAIALHQAGFENSVASLSAATWKGRREDGGSWPRRCPLSAASRISSRGSSTSGPSRH